MTDDEFIDTILDVARALKGTDITSQERDSIIGRFNNENGTEFAKAKKAIESVLGQKLPQHNNLLDHVASLNNIQYLLKKMNDAANKWGKK